MKNAISDIKALYDENLKAVKMDLTAMLNTMVDYNAIEVYKILGPRVSIIINEDLDIIWDNEGLIDEDTNEYEALFLAHQFVLGMYMMYTMCSEQHVAVLKEVSAAYEAKLAEKKNLIITPGSSLL